jgi:hypothetical protein
MRKEMSAVCFVAVALTALAACSSGAGAPRSVPVPSTTNDVAPASTVASVVKRVALRSARNSILVDTAPEAACLLHQDGTRSERDIKLYSGHDGGVIFYVKPGPSVSLVTYSMNCETDGGTRASYPIEVRVTDESSAVASQEAAVQALRGSRGSIRPALEGDVTRLSNAELVARGYAPRPDPIKAPAAYAAWVQSVSKPTRVVHSARGTKARAAESNSGWSGYAVDTPGGSPGLVVVQGVWNAPIVDGDFITGQPTVSSMWVGLDGDTHGSWQTPGGELVQAGTEHDAAYDIDSGTTTYNYYGWFEWVPDQVKPFPSADFSVRPGDEIYATVWVTDGSGNLVDPQTGEAQYGWAAVFNYSTQQEGDESMYPLPQNTEFGGYSAEWILEMPNFPPANELSAYTGGSSADAEMWQCGAADWHYSWENMADGNPVQIDLYDSSGANLMSSAAQDPSNPNQVDFTWHNYQ